jgi:hypothetical protein
MMTFLVPSALFGIFLLAIPVIIHLFKPRKMRQTPFSSLRWLRETPQRLSRRIRWHQVLLFLLRAGFILLLVLALAQPLIGTPEETHPVDRFIVLDVSRSMDYRAPDQPTPLDSAKRFAANLIEHGGKGDRTALLLTGSGTRMVSPPVHNGRSLLPGLKEVRAGDTDTNLSSALPIIRSLLAHRRPGTDVELWFLTDNHQRSWSQGTIASFLKDLPGTVRVRVIDFGVVAAQNAWIAGARLLSFKNPARRLLRVEVACAGDTAQKRTVHVGGVAGLAERKRDVKVEPGRPVVVDFLVPAGGNLRGQVAEIELTPHDSLPSDDRFFLNLDTPAALQILLVEGDTTPLETLRPGYYLRTAVDALAGSTNNALELVSRTSATAKAGDFAHADVILLAGVPELNRAQLDSLEKRVQSGGGLVLFLGPGLRHEFYNSQLFKPLRPSAGLLPLPLRQAVQPPGPGPLRNLRLTHPLLAPLYDPVLGDLGQARLLAFYRFAAAPAARDTVLAWAEDDVPAIVEHRVGAGKVLLFNMTANDEWSDLPRRKSFVPLVDRLLSYLSAGGVRRSFEAGEAVTLPLVDWREGEKVTVRTPDNKTLTPKLSTAHGRTFLHLDTLEKAGVYRVERSGGTVKGFAFVVRVGPGDSVLTAMDAATLKKWWEPARLEIVRHDEAAKRLAERTGVGDLWPWLIVLAGVLLLAETYFVYRLCPRPNPTAADAVVHKRGLLRPMGSSPAP